MDALLPADDAGAPTADDPAVTEEPAPAAQRGSWWVTRDWSRAAVISACGSS